VGSEVLLKQVRLNFSFRNKFIVLLPCGLLVDNNTSLKMNVFKSLTGYADYGGYENRNAHFFNNKKIKGGYGGYVVKRDSAYTHIRANDHIVAGR